MSTSKCVSAYCRLHSHIPRLADGSTSALRFAVNERREHRMSSTAIDFESIEAQVRADAERKVTVLREIVDTHTNLTTERDAFLAADAERVRRLSALIAEAKAAGFDQKTLAPFQSEPLSAKRPVTRKRAASRARTASTPSVAADTPAGTGRTTSAAADAAPEA